MSEMKEILITCGEKLPEWCVAELQKNFIVQMSGCALDEDYLIRDLQGKDILITGGNEKITQSVFDACPNLSLEIFLGKQASTFHDPKVWDEIKDRVFTTGGGEQAVANEALRYINEFNPRRLKALQASGLFPVAPVSEKYPGLIIGPGTIGRKVLAGCTNVAYCGRRPKEGLENYNFFPLENLQEAIAGRRFVTAHLELTPETSGILKVEHFQYASPDLLFLNLARDGLMSSEEHLKLLEKFECIWSIWDVFPREGAEHLRLITESPQNVSEFRLIRLLNMFPRFWYTGHTAAEAPETYEEYGRGVLKILFDQHLLNS